MKIHASALSAIECDLDQRAAAIRDAVSERARAKGKILSPDHIVGAYFVMSRLNDVAAVGREIAYLMTSAVHDPPPGSLLAQCTGEVLATDPWDQAGRIGLVWIGFPVKMMQYPDGKVHSTDILHLMAGEGAFGLYDHTDIQLTDIDIPESILATFPGPAHGAQGIREACGFPPREPIFGTILKPCSGITPREVGDLVRQVAGNPLFGFIKEDENLVPGAPFCPLEERARETVASIEERRADRQGRGLFFAPHITARPDLLMGHLEAALAAGVNGIMFSELFAGGTTRMVREQTMRMANPPVIYAHNGGISTRTRSIWREVLDLFARLDGADFRQTAPVSGKAPFLRPYGTEWENCELALTRPLGNIKPTMLTRAGGLDQGNIGLNLHDAKRRGYADYILYLAGSAINSIADDSGQPSSELGSSAMSEAVEAFNAGAVSADSPEQHLDELYAYARARGKDALRRALEHRYPRLASNPA